MELVAAGHGRDRVFTELELSGCLPGVHRGADERRLFFLQGAVAGLGDEGGVGGVAGPQP